MPHASRSCPRPGCPNLQPCDVHKRATSTARGYDGRHRRTRADALDDLRHNPGQPCPWCGTPMHAGMALDWDHTKQGLTCASCNRSDGGRRAHQ